MTNREVTGNFNACAGSTTATVCSIMVEGTTMMTECSGNTYFYQGSGSSFTSISQLTGTSNTGKGVWVDLQNRLVITEPTNIVIRS